MDYLAELPEWYVVNQVGDKGLLVIALFSIMALLSLVLSRKIRIPMVVGYVSIGILLNPDILNFLPFLSSEQLQWYELSLSSFDFLTNIAVAFIAFTIGTELSITLLKKLGKNIASIVIMQGLGAFGMVVLITFILGKPLYIGLLLGAIATAPAPAATVMVLKEYRSEGPLTSMLMAVDGIADAFAVTVFSISLPVALMLSMGGSEASIASGFHYFFMEIFSSISAGAIIGYFSQKFIINTEDPTVKIMILISTVVGGAALSVLFHMSPLIINMSIGFVYRNFTRKNPGIEEYMETLTTPLYTLFFIIIGTELQIIEISSKNLLIMAIIYLFSRIVGKYLGAYFGGWLSGAPDVVKKYVGLGLIPQSGVAVALAYTVQREFAAAPEIGMLVLKTILFTAVLTEILGPLATKFALIRAGEINSR
ncbi:MAG: cation:proton antiporter [Halanaerobiales bacterium]